MANEIKALNIGGTTYSLKPEFADNAGKVNSPLKAGTKSYDGSAEVTITASDLGLSSALKYIGTSSTKVSDGGTESPKINGSTYTIPEGSSGQVVFYDEKEFVWNGSTWEFLGDDRNFKVIQSPVSDPVADSATSTTFIDAISQDANGLITATKKRLPSYLSTSGGSIVVNNIGGFNIYNTAQGVSAVHFYAQSDGANKDLGYLGVDVTNGAIYMTSGGNQYSLLHSGNITEVLDDLNNATGARFFAGTFQASNRPNMGVNYATGLTIHDIALDRRHQISFDNAGNLFARSQKSGGWNDWKTIAFTDSTVEKAQKLVNAKGNDAVTIDSVGNTFTANSLYVEGATVHTTDGNPVALFGTAYSALGKENGAIMYAYGLKNLYFYTNGVQRMLINSSGNVTIGGSDLAGTDAKLYVNGAMMARGINADLGGEAFRWGTKGQYAIGSNKDFDFYLWTTIAADIRIGTSATERMRVKANGNVLIGTTTDSGYKLDVNGTARINGNTTITGSCSASSGFFETSDSRLKDFKDPVKVDLDKLSKLTKAYFTFKNDPEKMHLGVSAQEIQEIYPEIVNENEEGFLSVDYAKLSVIALTAVDELNNRLNSIEERLSRLEK